MKKFDIMKLIYTLLLIICTLSNQSCEQKSEQSSFINCIKCANNNYYEWIDFDYILSSKKIDSFFISVGIIEKVDKNNYLKLYHSGLIDSIDKKMFLNSFESGLMEFPHSWTNYYECALLNRDPQWKKISKLLHVDYEDLFNNREKQIILLETMNKEEFANADIRFFIQKLIYMDIVYRPD